LIHDDVAEAAMSRFPRPELTQVTFAPNSIEQ
jgi:hypothetical protein